MSYTAPLANAANFSWVGAPAYTPPASTGADFAWPISGTDPVSVVGYGVLALAGGGAVVHGLLPTAVGAGAVGLAGGGVAAHGVAASGAGGVALAGGGVAAHGVAASGAGGVALAGGGLVLHPRYEVRGEVRDGGVLVNRSVRVYDRSTGHLIAAADTAGGRFAVHVGFVPGECYITPVDLDPAATDWLPPTANRVPFAMALDAT